MGKASRFFKLAFYLIVASVAVFGSYSPFNNFSNESSKQKLWAIIKVPKKALAKDHRVQKDHQNDNLMAIEFLVMVDELNKQYAFKSLENKLSSINKNKIRSQKTVLIKKVPEKKRELKSSVAPCAIQIDKNAPTEIKNDELIEHYGFKVEMPKQTNWLAMIKNRKVIDGMTVEKFLVASKVEEEKNDDVIQDFVKESKAAMIKKDIENNIEEKTEQDRLFNDFSLEAIKGKKISSKIPSPVSIAYQRAKSKMGSQSFNKTSNSSTKRSLKKASVSKVTSGKAVLRADYPSFMGPLAMNEAVKGKESVTKVKVINALLGKNRPGKYLTGFEFIPEYDIYDGKFDNHQGTITFDDPLNNDMSVLRGTLVKVGKMPTKIDLVMDEGEIELTIPLLDEEAFVSFLTKKGLIGLGGHLLIDLDDSVDSVTMTTDYESKIYFDHRFREVKDDEEHRYVLFVGIHPGNTLLTFNAEYNNRSEKIIHVTEGEVYFDINTFVRSKIERIRLFERNLMAREKSDLVIDREKITFFNFEDNKAHSAAVNLYEYRRPTLPLGMRKYLRLDHLEDSIFVGHWNAKEIEIPGKDFIGQVISYYDSTKIGDFGKRCIVQINLDKRPLKLSFEGQTRKGHMYFEIRYLDKDGEIGEESSILTEKVFIFGEEQGVISGKIEYHDRTVDYIQTFCSEDTYLVEQL